MRIFTFGDSHCYNAWNQIRIPGIQIIQRHLGPKLMYSFGIKRLSLLNIKDHGVQDGDVVVFCFGEIDVRCHIFKFNGQNSVSVIEEIVVAYMEAIKANIKQFSNLKTCIYFVPPVVEKETVQNNPNYPYLGTDEERRGFALCMNRTLSSHCLENGYIFIDLYDQYCNEKGFLDKALSDNGPHIKEMEPLKQFIINNIL